MVAQAKQTYITPEEYLIGEDAAEAKSEYVDGVIVAMAGASLLHVTICTNLAVGLAPHLRTAGCRGLISDMRIKLKASNSYYYPDYVIVCGKPEREVFHGVDSLLNPGIVFEVLSESTEKRDRGEKWLAYWGIESLSTYVLVHQDRPAAEVFTREPGADEWVATRVEGLDGTLRLKALKFDLPMRDIYEDVEFGNSAE